MKIVLGIALIGAVIWAVIPTECTRCCFGYNMESKSVTCYACKGHGKVTCTNQRKWFDEVEPGTWAIGITKGPNGKRGFWRSYRCSKGRLVSNFDHFNGRVCNKCQGTTQHNCETCDGYGSRTTQESVMHDACNGTGEVMNIQALFQ